MIKAVLFDMDGVLYDSMPFHARSWYETAINHNLVASPDDFYQLEGCIGDVTIDYLFLRTYERGATEEEKKSIYKEKAELFKKYNDGHVMPGAIAVLEKVKSYGLDILLVTGSGQDTLLNKLDKSFQGFFTREKTVTAYDVKYGKPNPEPYLMGLKKAGVTAEEAIVVENAPMGIESAVSAGIFTIAVNTGPLDDSVLLNRGANLLYPSMQSLADGWDELFKKKN